MRSIIQCWECGEQRELGGRRLCRRCYYKHYKAGTIHKFPYAELPGSNVPDVPGVTYRQLDFWVRQGYLRPEHAGGSGVARKWPAEEIRVLERMARLVRGGVVPSVAARVARGEAELVSL